MRKLRKPRQLKSGKYQGRVTIGTSDRSIGQFDTEAQAYAAQARWMAEHGDATMDPMMTFGEYWPLWLESRKGELTPETWQTYRGRVNKWMLPTFGKMRVSDINHTKVKTWLYNLPDIPSRRLIYSTLTNILEQAVQDGLLRVKPKVRGATKIKQERKPLYSAEQIWSVIDELPEWARLPFVVQWGFGGRISEALGLTWDMVDLKTGIVRVEKQFYKGREVARVKHDSGGAVMLTEDALEALKAHRRTHLSIGATPIFMRPDGKRLDARKAYSLWAVAREKAGIPEITPHALRRNDLSNYRVATEFDAVKVMDRARQKDYRSYLAYQRDVDTTDTEAIQRLNAAKKRKSS